MMSLSGPLARGGGAFILQPVFSCISPRQGTCEISDLFKDHLFIRKLPPLLCIVEDRMAIDFDRKDTTMSFNQCGMEAKIVFDRGCQTGCPRMETSFHTVGDLDGYGFLSALVHLAISK